jgi:Zn-dependent protease with chaperone function
LQDAKTSLDLMMTLSAFCLLFGLPLAVWMAVRVTSYLPWWFTLLLVLVALAQRLYPLLVLTMAGLILVIALPHATPFSVLVQTLLCLVSASVLFSYLSYQSAIQAALDYGEKIKAAFDQYRWQVLDTLHVQQPTNLAEERKTWEEICGLLARNYTPDPRYYRYEPTNKADTASSTTSTNQTTGSP